MRYTVPAGTAVLTAPDAYRRDWKPHTTRRTLVFATYRLKDADEFTFAYRGRLLRVPRSAVQESPDNGTVLYSLIFSLVTEPPAMRDLVVQLDEHAEGQFTKPADPSKTLLDVGPGDEVMHQGQRETVKAVRPYATGAKNARRPRHRIEVLSRNARTRGILCRWERGRGLCGGGSPLPP